MGMLSRVSEIARTRHALERTGWPRLQMSLIMLVTGAVGFLCSFALLSAGTDSMLVRYPIAISVAYGAFLLQMWIWLRWRDDLVDAIDLPGDASLRHGTGRSAGWSGTGGHAGGGGASASWSPNVSSPGSSGHSAGVDVLEAAGDEAGLPLVAALALGAVALTCLIAAGWVVWTAPALMAELIVDAAIAGGLYRRMQGAQAEGWWWLCIRHTFWPFVGVLFFFLTIGVTAQWLAPQASTLMQVVQAF